MSGTSDTWSEDLASLLCGPDAASIASQFALRAPASYRDLTSPAEAARDLAEIQRLSGAEQGHGGPPTPEATGGAAEATGGAAEAAGAAAEGAGAAFGGRHRLSVRPSSDDTCTFRLRRYGEGGIELTSLLPVLESFGLVVVEAVPHRIGPGSDGSPAVHIDDVGVRVDAPDGPEALRFVPEIHGPRLVDALDALSRKATDVDSLNRLVTVAGFDWRQVIVLRAYLRYWLQSGVGLSWAALSDPLVEFPDVARGLIGYFQARFDPTVPASGDPTKAPAAMERARCLAGLDLVPALAQDRVLRGYLALADATLRTNYFQADRAGLPFRNLVLKLDSSAVPDLPAPRPRVEAFVHGPAVEGVHLRAGMIARGGIRWSERPGDLRTEVLDLAFAQVKKNAIIVPTGAKGGFVCRGQARPTFEQVRLAYEEFVAGLLDITDNIVAGEVVAPEAVAAPDGPDPYLVVAADKGTATFSDLANSISERRGFWLGDAFASGGSRGYDHKAMGITARGAWVSVRRHFHQLGLDVQSDPISVVGVGDMSGDVFGNGMLMSRSIRLLAAFDHRHVFIDPDPDPEASFDERARLASIPRSTWADYKPELISAGGGVWARDVKSVPLSPAARRALGVVAESLTPPGVIRAILSAPADLLWFGGIGTYVKAPDEPDAEVGDHSNDAVRVTTDSVRARVIAEGANLGITQKARIRYSRRGGRINADFIDNAAGVATSDREVNLKILLALAVEEGRLDPTKRDDYLERSKDEVAADVLRQVDHSVAALNRAAATSAHEMEAYEALLESLEGDGRLDRTVEFLPDREEMLVRRDAGAGFIRPELAVVLAYAKSDLVAALEASAAPDAAEFLDSVVPYFPAPIREAFEDLIPRHRLYRQLACTDVAGEIVDNVGIVWAHETASELGRRLDEVASAFWAARRIAGAGPLWSALETMSSGITADAEEGLHASVRRSVVGLARAYLIRPGPIDMAATLRRDEALAAALADHDFPDRQSEIEGLVAIGVGREMAERFTTARARAAVAAAQPVVAATGCSPGEALDGLAAMAGATGVDRLTSALDGVGAGTNVAGTTLAGRLRSWQARALVDDVSEWLRDATISAIGARMRGDDGERTVVQAVKLWAERRRPDLDRALDLLSTLGENRTDPLTVAALVLRRLGAGVGTPAWDGEPPASP